LTQNCRRRIGPYRGQQGRTGRRTEGKGQPTFRSFRAAWRYPGRSRGYPHNPHTPIALACPQIQSRHANRQGVCAREAALSDVNQAALGRQRHRLRAANGVELFQNGLHVILHGVLTDVEDLSDFLIALPEGHLLQNLKFALG
jgi:hypothetical protein